MWTKNFYNISEAEKESLLQQIETYLKVAMSNSVKRIEAFRENGQKTIQVDLEKKYGQKILDNKSEITRTTEEIN